MHFTGQTDFRGAVSLNWMITRAFRRRRFRPWPGAEIRGDRRRCERSSVSRGRMLSWRCSASRGGLLLGARCSDQAADASVAAPRSSRTIPAGGGASLVRSRGDEHDLRGDDNGCFQQVPAIRRGFGEQGP